MDLNNLQVKQETGKCILRHPVTDLVLTNDDSEEMYIEVHGQDSSVYKNKRNEQQNKMLERVQRGKNKMTAESLDQRSIELHAECTASWNIVINKETPECTKQKAAEIYREFPWIREQVEEFISDRSNFFMS